MAASLKTYLTESLSYDSSWGVWAERIDGKFEPESDARLGQFVFENGGMDDGFELVGDNVSLTDLRDNYCGTDEDCEIFYEEWVEQFVEELNHSNVSKQWLKWKDIPTKVVAKVREGSLISLDETKAAEQALGQKLEWQEVEDSLETFGNYFQCLYQAILPNQQARITKAAIIQYRRQFNV